MKKLNVPVWSQQRGDTCGVASVGMVLEYFGSKITERDLLNQYSYNLLEALQTENPKTKDYIDAGNFTFDLWADVKASLDSGYPVIIGLNGSFFSSSGRGHIVVITGYDSQGNIYYNDPAFGKQKITTLDIIERSPAHPDGKFVFLVRQKKEKKEAPLKLIKLYIKPPASIVVDGKEYGIEGANAIIFKVREK